MAFGGPGSRTEHEIEHQQMSIAHTVDKLGRRYLEVPVFPEGGLKQAFAASEPDRCVDCGAPVRHAFERYFQRNESSDGVGAGLQSLLLGVTYDCVCAACGDRLLSQR